MTIKIGNNFVSQKDPTFIIAEACDNHMGDLNVAIEMARLSKLAGADAVKFQHHLPEEEMLPVVPSSDNFEIPLFEFLKDNALTITQHKILKEYCDSIDITYLCTPFSWAAALELEELQLPAYKIGSGEMTDLPYLDKIATLNKPLIISTGMSSEEEIRRTYNFLIDKGVSLILMNCTSEYPPAYEDINLGFIPQMCSMFEKAVIGHSDHTPDLFTCFGAVSYGARVIEKHVIIDKKTPGPDQSVSIDFYQLAELVEGIRKIEAAQGSRKNVHHKEKQIREWATRSLVSTCPIKAGEVISVDMIWSKRPGTGIPSHNFWEIVGRKALCDIPKNSLLSWDMIEK